MFGTAIGIGTVLIAAAVTDALVLAKYYAVTATAGSALSVGAAIYAIMNHNKRATIVYGILAVLSIFNMVQAYNYYCEVWLIGEKGVAAFSTAEFSTAKGMSESGSDTTNLYRAMSNEEYNSVMKNKGKFVPYDRAMEEKWFATTPEDANKWASIFYSDGEYKMIEIKVDSNSLSEMYYNEYLDDIGPAYCSPLDVLNNAIKSVKEVRH